MKRVALGLLALWVLSILTVHAQEDGGTPRSHEEEIEKALHDLRASDHGVKCDAVTQLVRLGEQGHVEDIARLLNDADARVRRCVLHGLSGFKAVRYRERFIALLADQDGYVRSAAAEALGSCGVTADESEAVRAYGAYALGKLGATHHNKLIAALLDDEDPNVIACAVWALGKLNAREYTEKMSALLNHSGSIDPLSASWLTDAFGTAVSSGVFFIDSHPHFQVFY